jgi:HAD superfamily hydrolase (TIGR01509 family)
VRAAEAFVFDLYGTLLRITRPRLHRELPALLAVGRRQWMELVRTELLTTAFTSTEAMAAHICSSLEHGNRLDLVPRCQEIIDDEVASVELYEGVLPVLSFLRRRGLKIGAISNLSSAHKEPVTRFDLDELLDASVYSCDLGVAKPDPEAYRELCRSLDIAPSAMVSVGDSLRCDILAPARLGMRTVWVGREEDRLEAADAVVSTVADLATLALGGDDPLRPLLTSGQTLDLEDRSAAVEGLRPLPQARQGRYNLVSELTLRLQVGGGEETTQSSMVKRYLSPGSAVVEELAFRLQGHVGLPTCAARVVGAAEPVLMMSPAGGAKYGGEMDLPIARELGRHTVFAYVFSNADMRPRNAFLQWDRGRARITMVDLEHCFFNLALDPGGIEDPFDPHSIDQLGGSAVESLLRRRVLTGRTLRRVRREFFGSGETPRALFEAFKEGFLATYEVVKARVDSISELIGERLYEPPFLIIGTRGYRRALARVDLEDIKGRIGEDPNAVLAVLWA